MAHGHLIKNTILLLINKFSGALTALILLPVYTSHFSVENFGIMDLIVGYIALIAPILSLKLDMGIFNHLINANGNQKKITQAMSSAFILLVGILGAFIAIALVVDIFVTLPFYYLVVSSVVVSVIFTMMSQVLRGLGQTRSFVFISIFVTLVSFLVTFLGILMFDASVDIILVALILSQSIGAIAMAYKAKIFKILQRGASSRKVQGELLRYSAPLVADGASFWIMNTSSRTILTIVLGAAANGIYAISSKFVMVVEQLIGVFFQAFIETATLYARRPNKSELYSDVMNKYLKILWSGCILLIVVIPFIFPIMVRGDEFASAQLYIPIMIVAVMVRAVQNFISAVYQANGHTKQIATTTLIGALVNLALNLVLVFYVGIWAAALASLIAYTVLSIYRYFDIRRYGILLVLNRKLLYFFAAFVSAVLGMYYINVAWLSMLNLVLAVLVVVILNRHIFAEMSKYLRRISFKK